MTTPIFITGGTGFIGSYLLRYLLKQGYSQLTASCRPGSRFDLVADIKDRIRWVEGDMLDIFFLDDLIKQHKQVYHCAAVITFNPRRYEQMRLINVEGTANLVDAALQSDIDKLVHLSSIAALGRSAAKEHFDESTLWTRSKWNSHYGITKFQGEQEVWRGIVEGLPAAIINPAAVLGAGRPGEGTCQFFNRVYQGLSFYPTGSNGFVDVRDVARFAHRLMESDVTGERYILSAENWSYRQLIATIAGAYGKKVPTIPLKGILRQLAWRAASAKAMLAGAEPQLTRATARLTASHYSYDHQKSIDAFHFQYRSLEDTIRQTAKAMKPVLEGSSGFLPLRFS